MSPVSDNPVIVPDRELEEEKKPGISDRSASAARRRNLEPSEKPSVKFNAERDKLHQEEITKL